MRVPAESDTAARGVGWGTGRNCRAWNRVFRRSQTDPAPSLTLVLWRGIGDASLCRVCVSLSQAVWFRVSLIPFWVLIKSLVKEPFWDCHVLNSGDSCQGIKSRWSAACSPPARQNLLSRVDCALPSARPGREHTEEHFWKYLSEAHKS